jgi:hypothetical protein
VPGDEKAKKAQSDILGLAVAALGTGVGGDVVGAGKGARTALTFVAAALLVAALGALSWVVLSGDGALAPVDEQGSADLPP